MGSSLLEMGRNEESAKALLEARAIYERVLPTVEAAKTYKESLGDVCTNLGVLHQNQGDIPGAAPHFERAFALYTELVNDFPNSPRYLDSLNSARTNLATVLSQDPATFERGLQLLRSASESQEQLVAKYPKSIEYRTQLALLVGNLGAMNQDNGRLEPACELLAKAVDQHRTLLAEQPGNPVLQARFGIFALKLAHGHLQLGKTKSAAATLLDADQHGAQDWITLRKLAGHTAEASKKALADPDLQPAERTGFSTELLDRAIDLMERSVAAGYRDVQDLEEGPRFAALRSSPRYPVLREHLRERMK